MKMIICGQHVEASDQKTISVMNPATGEEITTVPSASLEDTERALATAQEGKKIWGAYPAARRAEILIKAAGMFLEEKEQLAPLLCKEAGKTIAQARGEVDNAHGLFLNYGELIKHRYESILPSEHDLICVHEEPLGVVVCIVPFNFPVDLFSFKVAPALAAGNAVIVKPSSETPLANIYMTDLLIRAGVPAEALQIVTGRGSVVGRTLSSSPLVNGITLTGSTGAGIDVYQSAAKNLTRVMLELGGNDALVVLDDADLDEAVQMAIDGRIFNAGQICIASKRYIVQNNVKDKFTKLLIERLKKVAVGDPFDPATEMGSLVSEEAANEVAEQVKHTVEQGATCVLGGKKVKEGRGFFEPTVLTDVTSDMDIAQNMEVFGPVFPIIGFDTDEEALEYVNNSIYGLSSGIASKNMERAAALASKIDAGSVIVNGTGMYRTFDMPFGGHKMSGLGCEGLSVSLDEMCQKKTIVLKNMR